MNAAGSAPRTSRRRLVIAGAAAFVILLVLIALAVVLAVQAAQVKRDVAAAEQHASALKASLTDGEPDAAAEHLDALQRVSSSASSTTGNPLWRAVAHAPVVGDDVAAVRLATSVAHRVATEALPPVVDVVGADGLGALKPRDGRISIDALRELSAAVATARTVIADGAAQLEEVPAGHLVGALADPFERLRGELRDAEDAVASADATLQVMPAMLGADAPRTYLVMFQNNAEIRATGGLPGAYAVLHADDGHLRIGAQGSGAGLGVFSEPVVELTDDERELFGDKLATYFVNANLTPDFPRTAEIVRAMWRTRGGGELDGVLSVDPVALGYLLGAIGPVQLDDGRELTADNVVQSLLNDPYRSQPDTAAQDEYFASAARSVFDAVSAGRGEPQPVVDAVVRGARERRLLVWSAHQGEQAVIGPAVVSGALPVGGSDVPEIGVFLNDATGAKMQYYLEHSAAVVPVSCTDGVQDLRTELVMRSTAPPDAAGLPESVIGPGFGAPPGSMLMNVRLYAPFGGSVGAVRLDGARLPVEPLVHHGRPVGVVTVLLEPGASVRLEAELHSGPGQTAPARATVTPGVRPGSTDATAESGC